MFESVKLTERRADAYARAQAERGKPDFCFVAVTPQESDRLPGQGVALGIATANRPGYMPIPCAWARFASWDDAADHADELNAATGIDAETAFKITASTMGGMRFTGAAQ